MTCVFWYGNYYSDWQNTHQHHGSSWADHCNILNILDTKQKYKNVLDKINTRICSYNYGNVKSCRRGCCCRFITIDIHLGVLRWPNAKQRNVNVFLRSWLFETLFEKTLKQFKDLNSTVCGINNSYILMANKEYSVNAIENFIV